MFHLKCFIDGELHQEIKINPGQEIIIGRDDSADVKIESYPGISRQHVKLVHLGDKLLVERISQSGKLVVNGLSERSFEITGQGQFAIPPYNFEVLQEVEDVPVEEPQDQDDEENKEEFFSQEASYVGDFEKTGISTQELIASFKRLEYGNIVDEFKMDSNKWVFGRAKTCNVFIDHDKASRQHFEVFKLDNKFYIKDLGSSNGTFLNGHQLPANNEIDLKSGDVISIQDYKLVFEIKDSFVEKQIYNLPNNYKPVDLGHLSHSPNVNTNMGVKKVKDSFFSPANLNRQKKIRIGIALAILVGVALFEFMPTTPSMSHNAKQRELAAARQLAEENKIIENAKIAAIQYIGEARWSLCMSEVQRIQDLRPDDQDAAEIGIKCQTALEALERQSQLEAQERDRLAIIERVRGLVEQCRPKVDQGSAVIQECLQEAIELSPENEDIAKLFDQAEAIDRAKEEQKLKNEKYLKSLNAGLSLLKKADDFKDKQYWEEAIKGYQAFINSKYPDPKNNKERAKREVASIQSALSSTLKKALEDAKLHFSKENYRDAVIAARKGLLVDEYNSDLRKIENDSLSLLRIEIRSLYQDSILMEDLGKIHTAISKWKQIVERDVPGEEYFLKAEGKLKNYETEI